MINTIASGIQSDSLAGAVMCVSSCMLFTPSLYALLADLRLVRVYQAPTALTVGSTKCLKDQLVFKENGSEIFTPELVTEAIWNLLMLFLSL